MPSRVFRFLILTAFLVNTAFPFRQALAARFQCDSLLSLASPEVESKLSVPDERTLLSLRKLVGEEITIRDIKGRKQTFKIEKNKEHIYEDVYYDIQKDGQLVLYKKKGLLRERTRWDKKDNGKYKLAKVVTQAKNGPAEIDGVSSAINARSEIKGDETKDQDEFERTREQRIARGSDDNAVKYAYNLAGVSEGEFVPVLFSRDERFFLKLTPKGEDRGAPSMYLSLDTVTNRGLIGAMNSGTRREIEIEIIEDLSQDSPKKMAKRVYILNQITEYLQETYGLTPSQDSKYEGGVYDTVLDSEP
jgi:hypothetical protein